MKPNLRGWVGALYAVTALTYVALLYVPHHLSNLLGCNVNLPDLNPFLSASDFAALRACINQTLPDGRSGYALFAAWHGNGVDLIFPALFALALMVLTWRMANQFPRFARQHLFIKLAVIGFMPSAYGFFDYLENDLVQIWLSLGGDASLNQSMITSATTLKFAFLGIAFAILILFFLAALKHRRTT